jgi:hypothetical protein
MTARANGRCSGRQAEMGEDLGDHGRMFDLGDDRQGTAARDVDIEYPLEQLARISHSGVEEGRTSWHNMFWINMLCRQTRTAL